MIKKFRSNPWLLWGGIFFLLVLLIPLGWALPRGLALYHQVRGARYLAEVLEEAGDTEAVTVYCFSDPLGESARALAKKARGHLERSLAYDESAHTYLLLGRVNCLLGQANEAVRRYEAYTKLRPANPLGHVELALGYEAGCGAFDSHLAHIDLCPYYPNETISWKKAKISETDFIIVAKQMLNQSIHSTLNWYLRATIAYPDWAVPWLEAGKIYNQESQFNQALDMLWIAWQSNPEIAALELSKALEGSNDWQTQQEVLQQVIASYPKDTQRLAWWMALTNTYTKQRQWDEAIAAYQKALKEFPAEPSLYFNFGSVLYASGQSIESMQRNFENLVELHNLPGDVFLAIAEVYVEFGFFTESDFWFTQAIELEPKNIEWRVARGIAARDAKNFSLAEFIFLEILQEQPQATSAYYEISWLYFLTNRLDDALAAIQTAIGLTSAPQAWYFVRQGIIYESMGNIPNAITAYKKALEINPNNNVAQKHLTQLGN